MASGKSRLFNEDFVEHIDAARFDNDAQLTKLPSRIDVGLVLKWMKTFQDQLVEASNQHST